MRTAARMIAVLVTAIGLLLGISAVASAHEPGDEHPLGPAASSSSSDMVRRWETPRTVCVESRMGSGWSSDNAATELADDTIWYWNLIHREGEGSCDDHDQVIKLHRVNQPDSGRAWTSVTTIFKYDEDDERFKAINTANVYMNVGYPESRTWSQNRRTWVHELGHGMGLGHTSECDSIMANTWGCYVNHTTFTDAVDKPKIRSDYDSWIPTFEAKTYDPPSFTAVP